MTTRTTLTIPAPADEIMRMHLANKEGTKAQIRIGGGFEVSAMITSVTPVLDGQAYEVTLDTDPVPLRRDLIKNSVAEAVNDLLHYRRREDKTLPMGAIEDAVRQGWITPDEITAYFGEVLAESLGEP